MPEYSEVLAKNILKRTDVEKTHELAGKLNNFLTESKPSLYSVISALVILQCTAINSLACRLNEKLPYLDETGALEISKDAIKDLIEWTATKGQ